MQGRINSHLVGRAQIFLRGCAIKRLTVHLSQLLLVTILLIVSHTIMTCSLYVAFELKFSSNQCVPVFEFFLGTPQKIPPWFDDLWPAASVTLSRKTCRLSNQTYIYFFNQIKQSNITTRQIPFNIRFRSIFGSYFQYNKRDDIDIF